MFLHSCNAPSTVIHLLAHIGLSTSIKTIQSGLIHLEKESARQLRAQAKTLLTAFAYDNVDIDLKHSTPTLDLSGPTLKHLTSATLFPLHGVSHSDLNCADILWNMSRDNPNQSVVFTEPSMGDFLRVNIDLGPKTNGLSRQGNFVLYQLLHDIIFHGPQYFLHFQKKLEHPETVDAIPIRPFKQYHAKTMDIPCATPKDNMSVIEELMENQAGLGESFPDEPRRQGLVEVGNTIILLHGDLGVGEKVAAQMRSRSIDYGTWGKLRNIVFVPGFFHLKMACADAIWRIFLKAPEARKPEDDYALMRAVERLRPKETGKISSKPGFRVMHEVIQHVGICDRLQLWEENLQEAGYKTLEEYAETKPSWDDLVRHATVLAQKLSDFSISEEELKGLSQRDEVMENLLLRTQVFLLYEEFNYGYNWGDIGRVETTLPRWEWIFRSCGKHKYAKATHNYLVDVHFRYPEGLKKAVRYHTLVCPTGKAGHFRGVDWVVELDNLFGKVLNHSLLCTGYSFLSAHFWWSVL
jgi:hypothetical protein